MMAGNGFGARYPSRFLPYVAALIGVKFFRSYGLFLTYDLLKIIHVVQFLFLIKVGCSVCLIFLQKPFTNGKRLSKNQWFRVIRHAFLGSSVQLLWLFGLTLCGPFRTLLLYEHSDLAILTAVAALFNSTGGPAKFRGGVFLLLAIMGLLLFDHDDFRAHINDHPEGHPHSSIITHLFDHLTTLTGLSDHKGGVVLLSICLCLHVGYNSASKKLAIDVGGAKRLNALSTVASTVLLCPWAIFIYSNSEEGLAVESSYSLVIPFSCIILFVFIIDYYMEAVAATRLEVPLAARVGKLATFMCALFFSCVWNHPFVSQVNDMMKIKEIMTEEHMLSGGVVFSFILFLFATQILTSAGSRSTKGSLVGYSAAGLPLYNFTGDVLQRTSQSLLIILRNGLRQILEESDSRKIFYFLCINLAFTFVELVYGMWSNSLGLISDGFHMFFDCSALVMGLYASVMARWKATRIFSYGYDRTEILSGFINGLFLIVISFMIFMSAITRLFDPPEIHTERLLTVSVAGLVVNLFGILALGGHAHSHGGGGGGSHGHSHGHAHSSHRSPSPTVGPGHGHSHGSGSSHSHGGGHGHSHGAPAPSEAKRNTNMQGVFLHVLADTLGSVGVIISTLLIENFNWQIADPICSIFIAVMIFASVLPLVKETSLILLLHTPQDIQDHLTHALKTILSIEGVVSYRGEHFWRHSSEVVGGTLHVQIKPQVSEAKIVQQVGALLKEEGVNNLTIQVEKETFFQHMSGLGIHVNDVYEMTRNFKSLDYEGTADFIKSI